MKNKITRWLTPPIFEDDAEKTWRARLLNATLVILILFDALGIIGSLIGGTTPTAVYIIDGTAFIAFFILRHLLFSGKVTLTLFLLMPFMIIVLTVAVASMGTVQTPATSVFLLIVVIAGLLYGRNGIIITAASSSLVVFGLIIAENAGILPSPDYTVNITQWITYTLFFGLTGTLTYYSYQTTFEMLERQFQEVAVRKQTETALRQSEARYRHLFDMLPYGAAVFNLEGKIIEYNIHSARILGYEHEQGLLIGKQATAAIDTESIELFRQKFSSVLKGNTEQTELELVRKQGDKVVVLATATPIYNTEGKVHNVLAVNIDITKRVQAEQALHESEERYRLLAENAGDYIWTMDLNTRAITYASPAVEQILGFTPEEMMTMPLAQKYPPRTMNKFTQIKQEGAIKEKEMGAAYNPTREVEMEAYHRDGHIVWIGVMARIIRNDDGHPTAILGITRDITERVQVEKNLHKAKNAAEAANRAKSTFLSNMSHELRTPLNGILGYTQIFKRDAALTAEQQQRIDIIHHSGNHLLAMINNILDLSKIEADYIELVPIELHIPSFLQTIEQMIRPQAEQKGLIFNFEPDPNLSTSILADEIRLRQILLNLLVNAVKFTERGGITLRIQSSGNNGEDDGSALIYFAVEDSGVGIPLEQQAAIFEPFRQIGNGQKKHQGTGLGLTISQRFVQMMGGELHVESDGINGMTIGSRFWFELALPLVGGRAGEKKKSKPCQEIGYTRTIGTSSFKILVVDDFDQNRTVLNVLLTSLGFTVYEAADGAEAIAQTKLSQPDLIFMDLVMPDMDGLEVTRQIRRHPDNRQLPIIALSANLNVGIQKECVAAGCDDFLPKPFQVNAVLEKLHQYLSLEWLYEDKTAQLGAEEIILPSKEVLEELFSLSQYGDIGGIRKRLKALGEEDAQYMPFITDFGQLVSGFKTNEIRTYIQACLVG